MNQRRKLARTSGKKKTGQAIEKTLGSLDQAMNQFQSLGDLPAVIEGLEVQTKRAKAIADMMEEDFKDYQQLKERVAVLEEEVLALKGNK